MTQLMKDLEPSIKEKAFSEAFSKLQSKSVQLVVRGLDFYKRIAANLLLASDKATAEDFQALITDGVLNASQESDESKHLGRFSPGLCVRVVTTEAARALQGQNVK